MQPEQRIGRSVYRWSSGVAMGLAAIIDRGDKLSLCGKASMQKVRAVIELSKAKGWRSLVLTGPDEFKRLAVREALREGLRVTNPELADLVAQILKEQEMQMQDHQGKNNERMEQARRWLATAAPVNALEAAVLNKDADRLLRLFDSHPEAQRWQMIEHQRTQGIPESLLGFEIEDKNAAGAFEATVRHVGKRVWVEPKNRPGVVVPVIPSEHQRVRPGQRIAIQADGRIALMPERDLAPRPN